MSSPRAAWLDPLRRALDQVDGAPVQWFFRDDDAGWADDQLWSLADVFAAAGICLDIAAIPAAVSRQAARALHRRAARGTIEIHQHGWAHRNHESVGRACEFGPGRAPEEQAQDLRSGRERLQALLDRPPSPVFVPPWNRCSPVTIQLLPQLGFAALSRDRTAPPADLTEVRVGVDWSRSSRTGGLREVGRALAGQIVPPETSETRSGGRLRAPVGVMLHHADMQAADRAAVSQLLELVRTSPAAAVSTLSSLAAGADQLNRRTA